MGEGGLWSNCLNHLLQFVAILIIIQYMYAQLCRGGSVTNLVKSLRKRGKYLDEDLIAYILYETLKVDITCFDMFFLELKVG